MRFEGQLKSWNAERGFGFIEPAGGGQEIFVHVSAVPTSLRPPKIGQQFTFEVELNREGKKRAANVGIPAAPRSRRLPRQDRPARWSAAAALAIPVFVAIYIAIAVTRSVSAWVPVAYVGFSVVSLFAYALDKSAAVSARWRSSEKSLLLLDLFGGWPGGLVAQQLLRHKSSKASYRSAFWGAVLGNVMVFVIFHAFFRPALHA